MKRLLLLPVLLPVVALLGACTPDGLPNQPDININGAYTGRIVGNDQSSALLDVNIVEQNLQVTASVTSQSTGQTITLSGTRSVYKASPVTVNLTQEIGSGSSCPGGYTERYAVQATFYVQDRYSSAGAKGFAHHYTCDTARGQFVSVDDGSGSLELVRK